MNYQVNEEGYYGDFGGSWIPEMMYANIEELRVRYLDIIRSEEFDAEFRELLSDYSGRPSPLYFSHWLSEHYNTKIFLKREDLNHTGSHKLNNTIGQVLLAQKLGKKRIIAETGAGQHGLATATVCALKGLKCVVYMGVLDMERQEPNVKKMKMLGATVVPVNTGNKTLKDATNEAMRDWINHPSDTHYIIGSVVGPHPYPDMVTRFQSVISKELRYQLEEKTGCERPARIIACVGGGSNAAGAFYHFLDEPEVELIGVEAAGKGINSTETAATLFVGSPGVLHSSMTMIMQNRDGQVTEPYSISAGLDYPGIGPLHAYLHKTGRAKYLYATDQEVMEAARLLTQNEGIIPALESAHALAALNQIPFEKEEVTVVNLSGRGDKDMETYLRYFGY